MGIGGVLLLLNKLKEKIIKTKMSYPFPKCPIHFRHWRSSIFQKSVNSQKSVKSVLINYLFHEVVLTEEWLLDTTMLLRNSSDRLHSHVGDSDLQNMNHHFRLRGEYR